jgi:leucine dehydrogenase
MTAPWDYLDFDDHEGLHFFRDRASGLTAVIGVHSTALGPAAGGTRFWHYADPELAVTDVLRLSRGMSYKNAMAGLPARRRQGGDPGRRRSRQVARDARGLSATRSRAWAAAT